MRFAPAAISESPAIYTALRSPLMTICLGELKFASVTRSPASLRFALDDGANRFGIQPEDGPHRRRLRVGPLPAWLVPRSFTMRSASSNDSECAA